MREKQVNITNAGSLTFGWMQAANRGIEQLLYRFGLIAVPIMIGVVTLIALGLWGSQYLLGNGTPLDMRYAHESGEALTPSEAKRRLTQALAVRHYDTRLSETPVWVSFKVPDVVAGMPASVELPSRHAVEVACWNGATLAPLGSANRNQATGRVAEIKAGFAVDITAADAADGVLCRIQSSGPARISVAMSRF